MCNLFFFFFLKAWVLFEASRYITSVSRKLKTELFIQYVLQKKATAEIQLQRSQLFCVFLMPKKLIRKLEETMLTQKCKNPCNLLMFI